MYGMMGCAEPRHFINTMMFWRSIGDRLEDLYGGNPRKTLFFCVGSIIQRKTGPLRPPGGRLSVLNFFTVGGGKFRLSIDTIDGTGGRDIITGSTCGSNSGLISRRSKIIRSCADGTGSGVLGLISDSNAGCARIVRGGIVRATLVAPALTKSLTMAHRKF